MPVNSGSRAITQSMLLYQTTLMVMLLLDSPLHVLGLSLEDTLEYQSCLINGCDDLNLEDTELTGTLPTELGLITSMTDLRLIYNARISGTIPTQLALLTNLRELRLFSNNITGTIPTVLGRLTELTSMDLSYNFLTGTIPTELGLLSQLTGLYLENNRLSSSVPTELAELASLSSPSSLVVFNNRGLCGELSDIPDHTITTSGTALGTACFSPPPGLRSAQEDAASALAGHAGAGGLIVCLLTAAVNAL